MRFDKYMENRLRTEINEFKPDLVYERMNYLQLSGVRACKDLKVPHFAEMNSPYVKEKTELEGKTLLSNKATNAELTQLCDTSRLFAVSTALAEYFIRTHDLKGDDADIKVLPNAINLEDFKSDDSKVNSLRAEIGISESEVVIGFVGSMLKWHGVDLLIDAFDEIAKEFGNAKLLLVGAGASLQELKEQADAKSASDKIVFTGSVVHTQIPNYIELMDITVMANSNWYGSPIKIFEYAALKKAIIAPKLQPLQDVMEDEKHGLLIKPTRTDLVSALRRLLGDRSLRDSLAANFYEKVKEMHRWESNARVVIEEYNKLIRN